MAFLLNICLFFFNHLFNDSTILTPDDFKDTVSPYTQNRTGKADFLKPLNNSTKAKNHDIIEVNYA